MHLTPLPANARGLPFAVLLVSELKLMLKGMSHWWYLVAAGLVVAGIATPLAVSRTLLVAAWIWPLPLWSQMGTRESRYATQSLIFSAPSFLWRQLPAAWLAGVVVTALMGGGALLRIVLDANLGYLLSWTATTLFVPSMALALGVWSRNTKAFEVLYLLWWYAGPLNRFPALDFMGISPGSERPLLYAVLGVTLFSVAFAGRSVRLRLT
jgi:hypothetical protein